MKRGALGVALSFLLAGTPPAFALQAEESEETTLTVVVSDEETGKPIPNAQLTLRFKDTGKGVFKRSRKLSWSAKTNSKGRYRFSHVRKGRITLLVTAKRHQSFGGEFEVYDDNSVIEVSLKKPQPLL